MRNGWGPWGGKVRNWGGPFFAGRVRGTGGVGDPLLGDGMGGGVRGGAVISPPSIDTGGGEGAGVTNVRG